MYHFCTIIKEKGKSEQHIKLETICASIILKVEKKKKGLRIKYNLLKNIVHIDMGHLFIKNFNTIAILNCVLVSLCIKDVLKYACLNSFYFIEYGCR